MNKLTQTEEDIVQLIKDGYTYQHFRMHNIHPLVSIIRKLSAQLEESKAIEVPIRTQDCETDY
jgi:hypothetical protein